MRLALTLLALLLCQSAHAEPVLDQFNRAEHELHSRLSVDEFQNLAQTFVAGQDGLLSRLELYVETDPGLTGALEIGLHRVASDGLMPLLLDPIFETSIDMAVLPERRMPHIPVVPTFVDVSAFGMTVRSGQKYAISLGGNDNDSGWVLWLTGPDYLRGEFYRRRLDEPWLYVDSPVDMTFATYVEPIPEPATWALAAASLCLYCGYRFKLSPR